MEQSCVRLGITMPAFAEFSCDDSGNRNLFVRVCYNAHLSAGIDLPCDPLCYIYVTFNWERRRSVTWGVSRRRNV